MKIEVNLKKSYLFVIIGAILLLGGTIFVFAFGGNNPSVMGHSAGEILGDLSCGSGEALTIQNGVWSCVVINALSTDNHGMIVYSTAGSYTWTVPQGVDSVKITLIGAGGGAIYTQSQYKYGGHGGLVVAYRAVVPGTTANIIIGGHETATGGSGKYSQVSGLGTLITAGGGDSNCGGTPGDSACSVTASKFSSGGTININGGEIKDPNTPLGYGVQTGWGQGSAYLGSYGATGGDGAIIIEY